MGWEDYSKYKKIGQGSFGSAWIVKRKKDGLPLVCKEVNVRNVSKKEKDKIFEEVEVLRKLRHVNIVQLHEAFADNTSLNIIMEYGDGGDLDKLIKNTKGAKLKECHIIDMFTQICSGVNHIHSLRILHRDLKGANILITKKGIIKLCDFGVARVMSPDTDFALTQIGTPYFLSPEICEGKPYDAKSDVWSMGCVLYELCTLKRPFEADNLPALIIKIVRGKFPPISMSYSKDMRHLIDIMIRVAPAERASVEDVLAQTVLQQQLKEFAIRAGEAAQERTASPLNKATPPLPPPFIPTPRGSIHRDISPQMPCGSVAQAAARPTSANRPPSHNGRLPSPGMPAAPARRPRGKSDPARPGIAQLVAQGSAQHSSKPHSESPTSHGSARASASPCNRGTPKSVGVSPTGSQISVGGVAKGTRRGSKESISESDFQDKGDVSKLPKNVKSALGEQETAERELAKLLNRK